jgi:hypothetical protein
MQRAAAVGNEEGPDDGAALQLGVPRLVVGGGELLGLVGIEPAFAVLTGLLWWQFRPEAKVD